MMESALLLTGGSVGLILGAWMASGLGLWYRKKHRELEIKHEKLIAENLRLSRGLESSERQLHALIGGRALDDPDGLGWRSADVRREDGSHPLEVPFGAGGGGTLKDNRLIGPGY